MADRPRFGPAGKPPWFKCEMVEVPLLLREEGLDAFEFQAVRMPMPHVKVSEERALALRRNAEESDVWLTLHAPYFVNLSSEKPETVKKSVDRLVSSMRLAHWMGAHQVVFHPGYYGSRSREGALKMCIDAMSEVVERARAEEISNIRLGPETTGKPTQVGSLNEILAMCETVEMTAPTIDWAHIHARERGSIKSKEDYLKIMDTIEKKLGAEVVKNLHCHYTPVEFTDKGERRHHKMEEKGFGPDFKPLAEIVAGQELNPVIISESPALDKDSLKMKRIVEEAAKARK